MRLSFPDSATTILTYCTNVHPIESLAEVHDALARFCGAVRKRIDAPVLSTGLWLSRRAASELLAQKDNLARLGDALNEQKLELVTLNVFPYGDFQGAVVKEDVYRPDWADPRRSAYTLDLARMMARLLPHDIEEGTISTLPVTWGPARTPSSMDDGAAMLVRLAGELARLFEESGRSVRVCLEPEPGCVLETTDQAIAFFERHLRPTAKRLGIAEAAVERHLGLCFDACHQAVLFEDPAATWKRLHAHGVRVGKVQISCALEIAAHDGGDPTALLAPFDEPRFLHQVRARLGAAGSDVVGQPDIAPALFGPTALPRGVDWRVHFHVPLDFRPGPESGGLKTTADQLPPLFAAIAGTRPLPHFEVETYTWSVLPPSMRPDDDASLIEGIARELVFAENELRAVGAERAHASAPSTHP